MTMTGTAQARDVDIAARRDVYPDGSGDSTAGINAALQEAATTGAVAAYLRAGRYRTTGPVILPSGVTIRGTAPATQSGDSSGTDLGSVLVPSSSWLAGGLPISGAVSIIYGDGTTNTSVYRCGLENIWIDGSEAPAGVDGVASWGYTLAVTLRNVGIRSMPNRAVAVFSNTNFSSANHADGWYLDTVLAQSCGSDGFYGNFFDTTFVNCHAQSNSPGSGFYITAPNNRLTGCRSDLNNYGFTFDAPSGSDGYYDCNTLIGCGTQRNHSDGLRVVNFSATGTDTRAPVICVGCSFDGDGVNGGVGAGGFAGVRVQGQATLIMHSCNVQVMTVDVPGGCPEYALATATHNAYAPRLVQAVGGLWGAASATLINDAAPSDLISYSVHAHTGGAYDGTVTPVLTQLNAL